MTGSAVTALLNSRFVRFVAASGASVVVNLASRILFSEYTDYGTAIILAYILSTLTAWILNRLFVFERTTRAAWNELSRFIFVNIIGLVQVYAISLLLARSVFPAMGMWFYPELVAHFIGLSTLAVTSYYLHKKITFYQSR